jgi:hypothetical protein
MPSSQKCGVFLCRFLDSVDAPAQPASYFRRLFLGRGHQTLNDYWSEISMGAIDLETTEIHGWRTLPVTTTDFVAANPMRGARIRNAAGYFTGVDLGQYAIVIVVSNGNIMDAGSDNGVLVNLDIVNATFMAHEMAHCFGLPHSFDFSERRAADWSGPGEYYDRYDIMSAMNVHALPHPEYVQIGPRLCAHFVNLKGWMPPERIWQPPVSRGSRSYFATFDLVALGHPEQPGYLMATVGDYTIEFRLKEGWDDGIPRHGILIHKIINHSPYIYASDQAAEIYDWQPGQTWNSTPERLTWSGNTSVYVDSFDLVNYTARIRVGVTAAHPPFEDETLAGQLFGGIKVDGGGFIIIGGRIIPVPPRGPAIAFLETLADFETLTSNDEHLLEKLQIEKLNHLEDLVQKQLTELEK